MATTNGTYGDDTLVGDSSNDYICGLSGKDVLYGLGGRDTLFGGSGNDTLYGGEDLDGDRLIGGRGDDVYFHFARAEINGTNLDGVIEKRDGGNDTIVEHDVPGVILPAWVENLIVHTPESAQYTPTLTGNELDNVITSVTAAGSMATLQGRGGDDTLVGGEGKETFLYIGGRGHGHDVIDGGAMHDLLAFGAHDGGVHVDLRAGTARSVAGDDSWSVRFKNIEAVSGSNHDDILETGHNRSVTLSGNGGMDTLFGGGARDWLNGGEGQDWIYGGGGKNLVSGGGGDDQLSGRGKLRGDSGNDALYGTSLEETLLGGSGDDFLMLQGDDRLNGGPGMDTLMLNAAANSPHMWEGEMTVATMDLRELGDKLTDIERIDLGVARPHKLILGADEILALSSSTDTLIVLGDRSDSIDIVGSFTDEGLHGGYHRYQVGAATLLVDTDITNVS